MRKMHFEYVYKYKKYINFCGLFSERDLFLQKFELWISL